MLFIVSDDQDSGIQTSECERLTRGDSTVSTTSSLDRREMFQNRKQLQAKHNVKHNTERDLRLVMVKLVGVSDKTIGLTLARVPLFNIKCSGYRVLTLHDGGWAKG